jgi:maleate isomerase
MIPEIIQNSGRATSMSLESNKMSKAERKESTVRARELVDGQRCRIGIILPSSNVIAEPDISRMLPDGVTVHTTRLRLGSGSEEEMVKMAELAVEAANLLADAGVDIIAFHCTAVTMMDPELPSHIHRRIEESCDIPATSTAAAVLAAFNFLSAKRIVMVTPYTDDINQKEIRFLESHGIEVVADSGMDVTSAPAMTAVQADQIYNDAQALRDVEADACFISCTAIRASQVISAVERDFNRPVVTSNQALAWHCLRQSGIDDHIGDLGALFSS